MSRHVDTPEKILVLSDRSVIRESIAVHLRKNSFAVTSISDARELKDVKDWAPEIVIVRLSAESRVNEEIQTMLRKTLGEVPLIALAETKDCYGSESLFDYVIYGRYSLNQVLTAVTRFSKNPRIARSSFFQSRVKHLTRELEQLPA